MLQMTWFRAALATCLVAATAGLSCCQPTPNRTTSASASLSCTIKTPDSVSIGRWVHALDAAAGDTTQSSHGGLVVDATGVAFDGACYSAAALRWNQDFGGGIVISSPEGEIVDAGPGWAGARSPLALGNRRVGFTYRSHIGSGTVEERFVALCGLAQDVWVKCYDVASRIVIAGSGYPPSDQAATGMMLKMSTEITVDGDTLLLHPTGRYRTYGAGGDRTLDMGTQRVLLPDLSSGRQGSAGRTRRDK